jgi:hypothetical protein
VFGRGEQRSFSPRLPSAPALPYAVVLASCRSFSVGWQNSSSLAHFRFELAPLAPGVRLSPSLLTPFRRPSRDESNTAMPLHFNNLPHRCTEDDLKIAVAATAHRPIFLPPSSDFNQPINFSVYLYRVGRGERARGRGGGSWALVEGKAGLITFANLELDRRFYAVCQSSPLFVGSTLIR